MIEADLHIHSCYSFDSFLKPRTIVKIALKKGLSAIAVADHNTVKGGLRTAREATSTSLIVVPAIEVETDAGHVMGLFVEANVKAQSIDEVIEEIKGQGGITVLLHPARTPRSGMKELANKIDLIEAMNGRTHKMENLMAKNLALRFNKPTIAGSDAHLSFEIGCVRTILENSSNTLEDVRKHIVKGKKMLVGNESSYYIAHALSFGTELAKKALRLV